ncbi:MAG: BBP7 family outer membrane beta-barrel protein [Zavarzinella sp.]|nr:BBP7 family outer membrane beta-barrel protein [Zavarzinella sp.]
MSGARLLVLIAALIGSGAAATMAGDDSGRTASPPADTDRAPEWPQPAGAGPTADGRANPLRWWASAEYVFGWVRGAASPPLLIATPTGGGTPSVLFPNDRLNGDVRGGFQLRGGLWLDECQTCGIEAGVFVLCPSADRARVGDTPGTIIGRPFFNVQTGAPDFQLVSQPGALSGRSAVDAESSHFCAFDLAFHKAICCNDCGRLDALVGYRCLSFADSVRELEDLHPTAAPFPPGSRIGVADEFLASNQFHGLLVGLAGEYRFDHWYAEARGAVSLGRTSHRVTIAGATQIETPPAPPVLFPGGLLAATSNAGTFSGSDWVVVPEASLRLGYRVTEACRVFVGYSCLYWPKVSRAAEQIDPALNPDLLPPPILPPTGPIRPLFPDRTSALWVHAVSIGVEWKY